MANKRITADGEIVDTRDVGIPITPQIGEALLLAKQDYINGTFKFKTPFNHDTDAEAARCGTTNEEETLTQQHSRDEADINEIMRKFGVTGQLPLAPIPPTFMDVPDIDLATAQAIIAEATDAFEALPAETRALFKNDLARYVSHVDALREAKDWDAMEKLGLDMSGLKELRDAQKAETDAREAAEQARADKAAEKAAAKSDRK